MAIRRVSFYLDENLSPEILEQLRLRGIDIIRGPLGAADPEHLTHAAAMGRVVRTEDRDFLKLAAKGMNHAGIKRGEQQRHSIGDWVRFLLLVHSVYTADELRDAVLFVSRVD